MSKPTLARAGGQPPVVNHHKPFHDHHPLVATRLSTEEAKRLDRVLRRRRQSRREFLVTAIQQAEAELPADGARVRVDVPEEYAWMAFQRCRAQAEEWEQLAQAAKEAGEGIDVLQYRKAWGQWQDATSYFQGIVEEYRARRRRAARATPQRLRRTENSAAGARPPASPPDAG